MTCSTRTGRDGNDPPVGPLQRVVSEATRYTRSETALAITSALAVNDTLPKGDDPH